MTHEEELSLKRAIIELTDAVRTLTTSLQPAEPPIEEVVCDHPEDAVVDLSSMGSGPKWVCMPLKGGCGCSLGVTNAERTAMGLDPLN